MAYRKSFQHWLSKNNLIPPVLAEKDIDALYDEARTGNKIARALLISGHIRLGFSLVSQLLYRFPSFDSDELTSEMFSILVTKVDMLIARKEKHPNLKAYLIVCINKNLLRWGCINARPIAVGMQKISNDGLATQVPLPSNIERKDMSIIQSDINELISKFSEKEQEIFQEKLAGKTNIEIGEIMGVTSSRIGQILIATRQKFLRLTK